MKSDEQAARFLDHEDMIIGIIHKGDVIESCIQDTQDGLWHGDLYPRHEFVLRWRWNVYGEFSKSAFNEGSITKEQWWNIRYHLTDKYGIQWDDRGELDKEALKKLAGDKW